MDKEMAVHRLVAAASVLNKQKDISSKDAAIVNWLLNLVHRIENRRVITKNHKANVNDALNLANAILAEDQQVY